MAYNIKLFAHGVPNGQDIWGNPGEDAKYIEAFYGRKSNIPSQMFVEVMKFGNETNAYYTYFYYHEKIQDSVNRPGGYFALTLRINYYYADIQNIYNLLDAAFNKFIIGSIMEHTASGGCRFVVSQFKLVSDNFKALEQELQHYLMQFSSNKDFISLGGFKSNGQNNFGAINLLEATPGVVANHVKSTGRISISSHHPSLKEQQIINRMNTEMQNVTSNAQQQIAAIQQKARQDILSAQRDKEQGIQSVKNEYRDADKTISQLRAQNDKAVKEISRLSALVNELNVKLQNIQVYKSRYEESERKLVKKEKLITDIRENLSALSGISELLGISSTGLTSSSKVRKTDEKANGIMSIIERIHPIVDLFVMLILLGIIGVTLPKSCGSKDVLAEGTQQATVTATAQEGDSRTGSMVEQETVESLLRLLQENPGARIDVSNINETQKRFMKLDSEENYLLSTMNLNIPADVNGEWECDTCGLEIHGDTIIPKRLGAHEIAYKVKGVKLLTKTITVTEK